MPPRTYQGFSVATPFLAMVCTSDTFVINVMNRVQLEGFVWSHWSITERMSQRQFVQNAS